MTQATQIQAMLKCFQNAAVSQLENGLARIEHCLIQLSDDQLWWRPDEEMNSIANLLQHLKGNIRQWIVCGLTGEPDTRQRQLEFDDRSYCCGRDLFLALSDEVNRACEIIKRQRAEDLIETRHVQEWDLTGCEAIWDSVGHFSGHVQEIIMLTRLLRGEEYRFFFVPSDNTSQDGCQR